MNRQTDIKNSLVEVSDSVLVIIDLQDSFLAKFDNAKTQTVVANVAWLSRVAQYLDVPIIAMGENIEILGSLSKPVLDTLPEGMKIHSKNSFGLCGDPEILAGIDSTGRKTAILVGMETDVCVAQSAVGLMEHGFQVVALKDAMATSEGYEEVGHERMRRAGAVISSVKALYFEWMRSVANCKDLNKNAPDLTAGQPDCLVM